MLLPLESMVICYVYFLEHYEEYQLSFESAGAIALPVFGKIWAKGACGTDLEHEVYHFGGPHLEALALWILNLIFCFLENIIMITISMYL